MQHIEDSDTEPNRLPTRSQLLRLRLRRLRDFVLPTLLTGGAFGLLFFVDFLFGTDLAIFGVRDPHTEERVIARHARLIVTEQARVFLAYLVLGLLVGVVCQGLMTLWEKSGAWPARGRRHPDEQQRPQDAWPLSRRIFMTLLLALGLHLWQLCHAIARFPQLFAEMLYDRGGLRRSFMVAITHLVPSTLIDGLALGALAGLLLGPALTPHGRRWLGQTVPLRVQRVLGGSAVVRRASVTVLVLLSGGVLWLALPVHALTERPAPAPAAGGAAAPSVLLIAVDSLRADRVGPLSRPIAPNIAALADRSVRFESAFVTVPRTFPSFVTILTGRYPHHHGIRTMFPSAAQRAQVGPALPKLLAEEGFFTQVFSDFCGEIFSRIDLGFADVQVPYYDLKTIVRQRSVQVHLNLLPYMDGRAGRRVFPALAALAELSDPELLADQAIASLRQHRREHDRRPFFMTVFFSAAHFPYAAPAPYYRRFADPAYRGPFRYHKPPWAEVQGPADEQQVRALYNGAVAAADAAIGRLLQTLEQTDLYKNTIVILMADHGENLYDEPGRGMGHGDHLEGGHSLQIPFLVYDPVHRFAPHSVPGIVRDVDLVPTLLELLGAPAAALPVDGVSLLPLLRGDRGTLGLRAFSETELWFTPAGPGFEPDNRLPYPGVTATIDVDPTDDIFLSERWRDLVTVAKHRSLRTERFKLIYRPTRSGVHWSLYDIQADPAEVRDVLFRNPQEFSQLQSELLRFLADDPNAVVEGGYVIPR